ncbi:ribonuclease D [Rhodospirillum rubrum]|uniref:3'-5' exonuclease n=1 Tax=Rhodospirillum rubrum (strain ATCC 11170 / ATH 1.1.1 / DSM 467 / LMG 4362 / NCIMB 8255 / S1) TaxID=269796 RepID=Q2RYH5_RHORT|nr:ribonuclease D [Rhodospirillum rubrum]ABC20820.1 3'-5' exonuclease [Rhodospirillum rubrum ATCC 11170]AEO46487.1 3'-5' exonuclease [Rhodospirillum rubrum F11]MBK1665013.1 ribonuclease D [Rhodospirillum rubrum]MBK1677194.1 ribonuclease D [Rhodospirillum rubrum]MBK5956343.1 ribonuclease D [Rhodospirillum rubrum]
MTIAPTIHYHRGDLPSGLTFPQGIAVDTETMGLNPHRDRLCVVQLSGGDNIAHVVHLNRDLQAPVLASLLGDPSVLKIMHFGRFDIASIHHGLGVLCEPVYCTKIASKLCRTNTDSHGLKALCKDLLGVDLSKHQQTSDWGAESLSPEQLTYAASDVLYLHALKARLDGLLAREGRTTLAEGCFRFLPTRALLDLAGWEEPDIFSH